MIPDIQDSLSSIKFDKIVIYANEEESRHYLPKNIQGEKNLQFTMKLSQISSFAYFQSGSLYIKAKDKDIGVYSEAVKIQYKNDLNVPPYLAPVEI